MDLQYLVTFNNNTKVINVAPDCTVNDLYNHIKEIFKRNVSNVQYFNEDWNEWIDIDELPPTKTKLKVFGEVEVLEVLSSNTELIATNASNTIEPNEINTDVENNPSSSTIGKIPLNYKLPRIPKIIDDMIKEKNQNVFLQANKSKLINVLYEDMTKFYDLQDLYPSHDDYARVSETLVKTYPFLLDKDKNGPGNTSWLQALKYKFKRERKPLVQYPKVFENKVKYGHKNNKRVAVTDVGNKMSTKVQRLTKEAIIEAETEDEFSIMAHKKHLQLEWKKTNKNMQLIDEKMTRTVRYRQNMAFKSQNLQSFLTEFPPLENYLEVIKDFSRTSKSAELLHVKIKDYFRPISKNIIAKASAKKSSENVLHALNEANEENLMENCDELDLNAALLLIPLIFKEDLNFWYTQDEPKLSTPTIKLPENVIRLADPVSIAVDGVMIECPNILKGVATLFSSYYVFQIEYPKETRRTLEFFQKLVAGINPKNLNTSIRASLNQILI